MQGKVGQQGILQDKTRITPACAGKSMLANISKILAEDHPCVCREKNLESEIHNTDIGSPLRVQGKVKSRLCR